MSIPTGRATDTEPLELWEYTLIMAKLPEHWRIFYELMWQTGTRVGEVLHLSKRDIENGGIWKTSEKRNDKHREFVPLTPDFYRTLQDLSDKRREAHLFPDTPKQRGWHLERLPKMPACVQIQFARTYSVMRWDIEHTNRQTTSYSYRGCCVIKILSSTQRYIKPTIAEVRDVFRNVNKGS